MIKIHYKFVGCLELPSLGTDTTTEEETRKGIAVEYVSERTIGITKNWDNSCSYKERHKKAKKKSSVLTKLKVG